MSEVLVALPGPIERIEPLRSIRSTLIGSSLQALRARDLTDAYFAALPREHHDTMRAMVAGLWIDLPVAQVHYDTVVRIVPNVHDQIAMGRDVADKIHRSVLSTLARLATASGVTPWTGLAQMQKLYDRLFVGGAAAVYRTGPKDARVDLVKASIVDNEYFRNAFRGVVAAGLELFCRRAFVAEQGKRGEVWTFKLAWA